MYYNVIILITVFSQMLLMFTILGNEMLPQREKKAFLIMAITISVLAVFEWLGVFLNGAPLYTRKLHLLVKLLEFMGAPFVAANMILVIQRTKYCRVIFGTAVVHAVFEAIAAPFGWIIIIDEKNYYIRGSFYWIYIAVYLMGVFYIFYELIHLGIEYQMRNMKLVVSWVIFLIFITTIQTLYSSVKVDWLSIGIAAIIFYMYYNDLIHHVDGLTKLLNRACYQSRVNQLKKPATILVFDIDRFKCINDQFGHIFGDVILEEVAKVLQAVYVKYGKSYRIGGDEFCVIIENREEDIEELNRAFIERIQQSQRKIPNMPMVSFGYAEFHPGSDNVVSIIEKADKEMYKNKHLRRQQL